MEFRSFVAGMLFLIGAEILMPILGIKVDIVLPYAPYSTLVAGIGCIVLSYFVFRNGERQYSAQSCGTPNSFISFFFSRSGAFPYT